MIRRILIPLLIIFTGCTDTKKGIIPEEEMASLIMDIKIVESGNLNKQARDASWNAALHTRGDMAYVFKKHNTSEEAFSKSHKYYEQHPEVLEKIYDRAIVMLQAKAAENRRKK